MTAATDSGELIATWLRTRYPVEGDPLNPLPTLLAEALDTSETGIDVDDGTLFKIGDVIAVDREMMTITNIVTNTLTVTRATNSTAATHADNSEIGVFRSRRFKLAQPLQPQAVDNFPGKVTIGPYNIDSNDLLSTWNLRDFSGGHGIADHDEGVTDNRYRFGTLYTRYPGQWSKPFSLSKSTLGTGRIRWLGDQFYNGTVYRMAASGSTLFQNTTDRGALTAGPYATGVSYSGSAATALFYVPQSASGYSTFNPATNVITNNNGAGDPDARSFLVWDEKLLVLDATGYIWYATTAAATTTFTNYTLGGNNLRLDAAYEPYRMHVFYNRVGEPVPYVVTSDNVWVLDADTPRLYRIPDFESQHPRFGRASAVWRGELYVSSGMDILAFNGEVIRNVGLSRDDGLPYSYQDHIISLTPTQNSLYALVNGITSGGVTYHSVHEWSGFGWHCIYTTTNANGPQTIQASSAGDTYKLYWGLANAGTIYTYELPIAFTNPRSSIEEGGVIMGDFTNPVVIDGFDYYSTTYYLHTGRFDANMQGYRKIASSVEIDVRAIDSAVDILTLWYRIDAATAWTQLPHSDGGPPTTLTVTSTGHHQFQFGHYDPSGSYIGIDFESIEFKIQVVSLQPNPYVQSTNLVIESLSFAFLKLMNPSLAWTAQVDLVESYHDASPQVLLDELTELRTLPRFFSIQHKARTYRARMTGEQGIELGGQEEAASVQMSLIEIPQALGIEAS